jgi:hypothetical protein
VAALASSLTITDPKAYASMFRVVMNKFLNESHRKLKHADDIIDKMVDTEVEMFSKTGKAVIAAPPVAAVPEAAVVAASPAAATPARQGDGGACLSWLANGLCKKHEAGECPHVHPENRRGGWTGHGQKRSRPGGGGGGGSGWNSPWDGGWAPQWDPGWGGSNGWAGNPGYWPPNGGQGGKGGKGRGKGGGKGGWY